MSICRFDHVCFASRSTSTFKYNVQKVQPGLKHQSHNDFLLVSLSVLASHVLVTETLCIPNNSSLSDKMAGVINIRRYIHVIMNSPVFGTVLYLYTKHAFSRASAQSQCAAKSLISTSTAGLYTFD